MMTDPIADMLTSIRNAVRIERPHVEMPLSKVKCGLAEVLKREGYIWDWSEEKKENPKGKQQGEGGKDGERFSTKQLVIQLKYGPNGERVIRHIRRISKPGRRVYSPADPVVFKPVYDIAKRQGWIPSKPGYAGLTLTADKSQVAIMGANPPKIAPATK